MNNGAKVKLELTNREKIEVMRLAEGNGDRYKKMVDLIINYEAEKDVEVE